MKKHYSWAILSICLLGFLASPLAHTSAWSISSYLQAEAVSAPPEPSEVLTAAQKAEKIRACGEQSLSLDTLSDYPTTPTPFFPGYAEVLVDPHESLLAKIALIQNAKHSIDFDTYIYSPDLTANAYTDELRKAIRRGVNVRFMVDAAGSKDLALTDFYNHIRALLFVPEQAGKNDPKPGTVDVVVFRPLLRLDTIESNIIDRYGLHESLSDATIFNVDRRSHDKILLIDKEDRENTYAIVGGRNVEDSYYGVPQFDNNNYEDMELLVKDDPTSNNAFNLSNTLEHHFQDLFCAKGNRWIALPGLPTEILKDVEILSLDFHPETPIRDVGPELDNGLEKLIDSSSDIRAAYNQIWGAQPSPENAIQYFNNKLVKAPISPADEEENITRSFKQVFVNPDVAYVDDSDNGDSIYERFKAMAFNAKTSIDICTPYIFLPPDERDCLKAWLMADDSRHLRVLSSSVSTSDSLAAMATYDIETAPKMLQEGPYSCDMDGIKASGHFVNKDKNGNPKVQMLELGRLDNIMFKGNVINGQKSQGTEIYGKLHSKFAIVDGELSWVGSDNLDERSRHLNSETAIFVDNKQIATDLTTQFQILVDKSIPYGGPDWKAMQEQPQVQVRLAAMKGLEALFDLFPDSAYGD